MTIPNERAGFGIAASRGGVVLALYAGVLLLAAYLLPWWRMENRAPQYGKRVLVVEVSPSGVAGDVNEIDGLGHYVGIRPMATFAEIERAAAPYAVGLAAFLAFSLPFLRPGRVRTVAAAVLLAVPLGFVVDLWAWQRYAVTHLDPHASLNMIRDRVDARVIGSYAVAQFRVDAGFQAGFWLACVAAANAAAFLFVERAPRVPRGAPAKSPARAALPVAVASVLAAATAAPAAADTLEVGPDARFETVTAAVAAAAPGADVVVRPGTYREHVAIDKPLVLRGEPGAVIDGGGDGTVVLVRRGPATVRGLRVRGSGTSLLAEDCGVKLVEAAGCTVEACRIDDCLFGVLARTSPRARVAGNEITGKDLPLPRRADAIRLQDSRDSVVEDNVLARTRDLAVWQSDACVVRRNKVTGARYGLHYMYCDDNLFEDNEFVGNHTGAAVMYSRRVTLRRNRFSASRGPSAHGLLLKVADDVTVEGNWVTDNSRGLFLDGAPSSRLASCTIRGNVIGGNDAGVTLEPSVAGALFTENVFVANRAHVEVLGRADPRANRWSDAGRGNFWSDHVGFDADGDGVGDEPYVAERFFEDLAGRWPEVGLLRGGPAAEALELAARAFPVVAARPTLVDEHPLVVAPACAPVQGTAGPRWAFAAAAGVTALVAGAAVARARAGGAA